MANTELVAFTAQIVSAYFQGQGSPIAGEIPKVIADVHAALRLCTDSPTANSIPDYAAEAARDRFAGLDTDDLLVCRECGAEGKTLRRHLMSAHRMTETDYKEKFGLPETYSLTAPSYSAVRSELAKTAGLGKTGHSRGARQK